VAAGSTVREKPGADRGAPRSETNTKGDDGLSRSRITAAQWVHGRSAVLGPADVQGCGFEVDLLPTQVHHFSREHRTRWLIGAVPTHQ
jgi:hypothetical protein